MGRFSRSLAAPSFWQWAASGLATSLASVDKVWLLSSSLVSFTLSFFLTQSYAFWRSVYSRCRSVQGRLNDIGLLAAASAERDANGAFTEDATAMLSLLGRYVRLFSMLLYSSVTSRFAILRTPRGLGELVKRERRRARPPARVCATALMTARAAVASAHGYLGLTSTSRSRAGGALTSTERDALLRSSLMHNAVLEWITTLLHSSLADGRLCGSPTGGNPLALQMAMQQKVVELRASYAGIEDELTGRMPLAYTQLVQIMADLLISFTPFALIHSVGGIGAVIGTALVTLFHSSILNLAKMFLDPLNNDLYSGNMGINVATLMQETNDGSERWCKAASWIPEETKPRRRPSGSRQHGGGRDIVNDAQFSSTGAVPESLLLDPQAAMRTPAPWSTSTWLGESS